MFKFSTTLWKTIEILRVVVVLATLLPIVKFPQTLEKLAQISISDGFWSFPQVLWFLWKTFIFAFPDNTWQTYPILLE